MVADAVFKEFLRESVLLVGCTSYFDSDVRAFLRAAGYDERHPLRGAEAVEIRERLKSLGLEFRPLEMPLKHLKDTWDKKHSLSTNKSLTWTCITYHYLPLRRVLWRKHPVELARRWIWALEWVLIQRHRRRSIFSRLKI